MRDRDQSTRVVDRVVTEPGKVECCINLEPRRHNRIQLAEAVIDVQSPGIDPTPGIVAIRRKNLIVKNVRKRNILIHVHDLHKSHLLWKSRNPQSVDQWKRK